MNVIALDNKISNQLYVHLKRYTHTQPHPQKYPSNARTFKQVFTNVQQKYYLYAMHTQWSCYIYHIIFIGIYVQYMGVHPCVLNYLSWCVFALYVEA